MRIEKTILTGKNVRLEPLSESHVLGLTEAINDGALWELPVTIVPHPSDLPLFFSNAELAFHEQRELAFAIIDMNTGSVVGSSRFRCIDIAHKRVEIGFTFIAQSWQRTHINTEAKLLMLSHAFEHWQFNRVEFLTDVLNTKSRNAITRIGGREEGVLRNHMVARGGRIRDSVIFSVIKSDWPYVKNLLTAKLATTA